LPERSEDWISQARRDLENAEYEMEGGFYEWSCFMSQQSAKKAVKAVFQKLGGEAFGHSVAGLLEKLPEEMRPSEVLIDKAKELDKAHIPTRYPNAHPEGLPFRAYTKKEVRRLLEYAREILEYCESLLSRA